MPFDSSRRLTGSNLFFASAGAVLDLVAVAADVAFETGWRARIERAFRTLGWPSRHEAVRRHATGTLLAIAAPVDQLYTATEINEWAAAATLVELDSARWSWLEQGLVDAAKRAAADARDTADPQAPTPITVAFASAALPVLEESAALARFIKLSALEAAPALREVVDAARKRGLVCVLDDDALTLGSGEGGRTWLLTALPRPEVVPWQQLRAVPTVVVTGSNGKTTTVRLLAACARAAGLRDGYNCTDGLFIAGEHVASGDYSGPVGTRTVLRDTRVQLAVLETARGGILRRGLAVDRADVAVVTNVSADHFGEYGIHDLASLADVKLVVASLVGAAGLVVLNAEDPLLRERGARLDRPIGWFARDDDDPLLVAHRARGGSTSGVRAGRLLVAHAPHVAVAGGHPEAAVHDLGDVAEMPLTVDGSAGYNVSNVAGAALAAVAIGIEPEIVARVLASFGADAADNPGRLMRYVHRGATVLVDYAHNPEGLAGLLEVAVRLKRPGRLGLLLGQAGNRETRDIERLAVTAAEFHPDVIVIKEIEAFLRGRAPGEVPAILRAALLRAGMAAESLDVCMTELAAVHRLLAWSRPGDVLVLPVHDRRTRAEVVTMLQHPGPRRPDVTIP